MSDVKVSWNASPSANVTGYSVVWNVNGTDQAPVSVPRTSALDSSGYSLDFATSVPSVPLNGGDVVGATVASTDSVSGLSSSPVGSAPPTVTIPTTPVAPAPPTNVTLELV